MGRSDRIIIDVEDRVRYQIPSSDLSNFIVAVEMGMYQGKFVLIKNQIAAHASYIVTNNVSDFATAELKHVGYEVVTPKQILRLVKP